MAPDGMLGAIGSAWTVIGGGGAIAVRPPLVGACDCMSGLCDGEDGANTEKRRAMWVITNGFPRARWASDASWDADDLKGRSSERSPRFLESTSCRIRTGIH
jgi:hypothetical protein